MISIYYKMEKKIDDLICDVHLALKQVDNKFSLYYDNKLELSEKDKNKLSMDLTKLKQINNLLHNCKNKLNELYNDYFFNE